MKQLLFIFFISILFFSCSHTARMKHHHRIHGLTKYPTPLNAETEEQRGDTVSLKRIAGLYLLQNDTLIRIKK